MPVMGVDERKEPMAGPYVVRMGGWTLEHYLREAPEDQTWEFVRGEIIITLPRHRRTPGRRRFPDMAFRRLLRGKKLGDSGCGRLKAGRCWVGQA